jgi:hypothetical protein
MGNSTASAFYRRARSSGERTLFLSLFLGHPVKFASRGIAHLAAEGTWLQRATGRLDRDRQLATLAITEVRSSGKNQLISS